jgi:conjugative transfer signal peptidase TraF
VTGRFALFIGAAACGVAAVMARVAGVWINLSPSLPIGIYRTVRQPPSRGATVVVCLPDSIGALARKRGYLARGDCPGNAEPLGKTIAAVAGDTVDVTADGVWINGRIESGSRPIARDGRGRRLVSWQGGPLTLTRGQVFLLATASQRSFDSRYFGPVSVADVRVVVKRISMAWPE